MAGAGNMFDIFQIGLKPFLGYFGIDQLGQQSMILLFQAAFFKMKLPDSDKAGGAAEERVQKKETGGGQNKMGQLPFEL